MINPFNINHLIGELDMLFCDSTAQNETSKTVSGPEMQRTCNQGYCLPNHQLASILDAGISDVVCYFSNTKNEQSVTRCRFSDNNGTFVFQLL